MTYDIDVIGDAAGFAALAPQWEALAARAAAGSTFLTPTWLHTWWISYQPPARLAIVTARAGGVLVGLAPLMLVRERPRSAFGLPARVLRFIGDGSAETDHIDFVVANDDHRAAVLQALVDAVFELPWDIASLHMMRSDSPNTAQWQAALEARGCRSVVEAVPCPRRNLPATYEALVASLPARFRTALRSSTRKLADKHAVQFGLVHDPAQLPAALETLFAQHAGRWQIKGQAGVFGDTRKREFYARLSALLLQQKRLRFYWLALDGRVVAQQFCFEYAGTVYLLQEGFDPAHAADNVGNVLRGRVFEDLITRGTSVYDFLAGTSRHKQNWADASPPDLCIDTFAPGWRGALFDALERLFARLRHYKHRWEARRLPASADAPRHPRESGGPFESGGPLT